MKPSIEYLMTRLTVDAVAGKVYWIDATKFHKSLNASEAGCPRHCRGGKWYWHVKVDSLPIKRSHIVFLFATGRWPGLQIDHINGNSLDDRFANLREATAMQNAWNHKTRAKKTKEPMGVRELPSGRFQARLTCEKQSICLGAYKTAEEASFIYQQKRKEKFGDYA